MIPKKIMQLFSKKRLFVPLLNYKDQHKFIHDLNSFPIPNNFSCRIDCPNMEHQKIIQRLIEYYHFIKSDFSEQQIISGNDLWKHICQGHALLEAALGSRDVEIVSEMMLNVCNTPGLTVGFENSVPNATEEYKQFLSLNLVDKLIALGESLGCIPVQCPEQGMWGYEKLNVNELVELIQARLPFDLTAPIAGGGVFGLETQYGILSERNLQAVYTAAKAHNLLDGSKKKIVCEIGGGIGSLTYYLAKAGMAEISLYDLPTVSIIQGYYLAKSLGLESVWFYGEVPRPCQIRILPYWSLDSAPDKYFSLAINQDSLPEIDRTIALSYCKLLSKICDGYFLSINQEGQGGNTDGHHQSVVYELIESVGGFQRIQRNPDWMRGGYVSEVYKIL